VVDAALRLAVRQGQEEDVAGGQLAERCEADGLPPTHRSQVRVEAVDIISSVRLRGHLADRHAGMTSQQAEQLPAAVAGAAGDGDGDSCHNLSPCELPLS